ncbi:unnamed protein product, partial [Closterium sp. NIES-53]
LDYATSLVAESASASVSPPSVRGECAFGTDVLEDRQEEFECFAATVPHLVSMLLAPEGDTDAPDIPSSRSYAEAIEGPYSSQWQAAMDADMASWKSTGTYIDEVPPPRANIVSGMWIFRVKRAPGSAPVFKARYVARGFSQRQGVDFLQTFSPTPKMTTLWVLLHVASQRDYELHSLDFSTAFIQGTLHEEIWLTTLAALGFAPSTFDPSLFLRTKTTLPPFYVLVYIDDLAFATVDTEALAHVKSKLQKRHTSTDLEPLGPEERGGKGAGSSGEAQAQGQPCDSAMAPMQPSLGPPRDEPRVFGLDKFNGDNFAEWSFKMENIFDHYDLLEVMEGMEKRPENDSEKSPWVRKSAQCYLLLGQALGSSQIRHIKPFQHEPEKGPKAWAALKGVHAPATAAVAVVLERQMAALCIEEDEAVEEGVQKFFDLLTRLEGADLNYSELQKKTKLLSLLQESWSSLIINLNRDLPRLSLKDVKRAILQEDFHRRAEDEGEADLAATTSVEAAGVVDTAATTRATDAVVADSMASATIVTRADICGAIATNSLMDGLLLKAKRVEEQEEGEEEAVEAVAVAEVVLQV